MVSGQCHPFTNYAAPLYHDAVLWQIKNGTDISPFRLNGIDITVVRPRLQLLLIQPELLPEPQPAELLRPGLL